MNAANARGSVVKSNEVANVIESASAPVIAAPMPPRPKERPSIMPEAIPALFGSNFCAHTRELGADPCNPAPQKNNTIQVHPVISMFDKNMYVGRIPNASEAVITFLQPSLSLRYPPYKPPMAAPIKKIVSITPANVALCPRDTSNTGKKVVTETCVQARNPIARFNFIKSICSEILVKFDEFADGVTDLKRGLLRPDW